MLNASSERFGASAWIMLLIFGVGVSVPPASWPPTAASKTAQWHASVRTALLVIRWPAISARSSNPGTWLITSLLIIMNMAATLFRLTVDEIIPSVTREAARALGRLDQVGTLSAGKWCDLAIWDIERPAKLVYRLGFNPLHQRVWHGVSS